MRSLRLIGICAIYGMQLVRMGLRGVSRVCCCATSQASVWMEKFSHARHLGVGGALLSLLPDIQRG